MVAVDKEGTTTDSVGEAVDHNQGVASLEDSPSSDGSKEEDNGVETDMTRNMDASDNIILSMRSVLHRVQKIEPIMPIYSRPTQRQRWQDVQETPHKEWGDIFFDLFYVAGAYNLGTMLREAPNVRGLFYFLATFFPIQNLWQYKMYWDSRFFTSYDIIHQLFELCQFVVLGTAVLYIHPVALLSNPEEHNDLFIYCLSITLGMLLVMGRSVETIFFVDGEDAARSASKRDAAMYAAMTLFYLAATVYAGIKHYGNGVDNLYLYDESVSETHENDTSAYGEYYNQSKVYDDHSTGDGDDHRSLARFLAGASGPYSEDSNEYSGDIAIGLLLAAFCFNHLLWFVMMLYVIPRMSGNDHRRVSVPMNIDYAIHRYGEWTMLMLGESVLSLLIVGVLAEKDYYSTFYCGIISISLLQIMHFRSQPHDPDEHAMRVKKERGYAFVILSQFYSAALIIVGATYKMFLFEFIYANQANYLAKEYDDSHTVDTGYVNGYDEGVDAGDAYGQGDTADHHRRIGATAVAKTFQRLLAGSESAALQYETEDRQQRIAHFFCGGLAAVFALCDLLIVVHQGIRAHMNKCEQSSAPKYIKMLGLPLVLLRLSLIAFMGSLSQYVTDPAKLSFIGLVCIVAELALRIVGTMLFHDETDDEKAYQDILRNGISTEFRPSETQTSS